MAQTKVARKKVTLSHGDVTRIAREIGRSPSHVWRVLRRQRESMKAQHEIAGVVGVPFDQIEFADATAA